MSADVAIDYSDGRENLFIPLGPQSWLVNYWRPIAEKQGWEWITRLCGNVCMPSSAEETAELLVQLNDLRSAVLDDDSIDDGLSERMVERFDRVIPLIADASANWDTVELVSIG